MKEKNKKKMNDSKKSEWKKKKWTKNEKEYKMKYSEELNNKIEKKSMDDSE